MTLLLDSHTLLWWLHDDSRLSKAAKEAIADSSNQVYVSVASLWEMSIKYASGKLPEYAVLANNAVTIVQEQGFVVLPIFYDHAFAASQLPLLHRDPFDRLLIALALQENMHIVSIDEVFEQYSVKLLW
jgi:PIN domain nuclease of toxin-antitoxin system